MRLQTINDDFIIRFEKIMEIIKDQLKEEDLWIVEENALKTFFNVNYDIDIMYDKIRYILKDSELKVKIEKNKYMNGKCINIFEFYLKDKINKVKEKKEELKDKINERRIKFENVRKEKIKSLIQEDVINSENITKEIINEISTNIPLPYTSICFSCKKKVIIACPELKCPNCGWKILESWD